MFFFCPRMGKNIGRYLVEGGRYNTTIRRDGAWCQSTLCKFKQNSYPNRTIIIFLNVYNTPLRHVTHTHFLAHSSSDSASDELYLKLLDA